MPDPTITFTGNRRNRHFHVIIHGKVVALTHAGLKAFIDLVLARGNSENGYVRLSRVTVYRVRQAINESLGAGGSDRLIETGCRAEYRLAMLPEQVSVLIAVAPCFIELTEMRVISMDKFEELQCLCHSR